MKIQMLIASALLAFASSAAAGQGKVMTWTIGSDQREALVYAPTAEPPGEKHPVIFAFHGHGGKMENTANQMNFQTVWPEAVVIYPQGLPGRGAVHDIHGHAPGWQLWPGEYDDRDLKFFDRMLETMRQKFAVDDRRIHAAGFSNGAIFCYVLWAKRAQTLAAIGPVAGCLSNKLPTEEGETPGPTELTKPLPVVHITGLMDGSVLLEWQAETINIERKVNNAPLQQGQACGDCCVLYQSSVQAPVKALFFTGGHEYPSWASAEFVKFFKAHKQP
jgi:polyhydroxybutyrate depolymerase